MFQARVDRAIDVLRTLCPAKARITFSGANPYGHMQRQGIPGGVSTLNEAADMEIYYRLQIEQNPLPEEISLTLHREDRSDSTLTNIENYFAQLNQEKPVDRHVLIVSSLFHLPRFIDLTAKHLGQSVPLRSRLSFVSAEDSFKAPTPLVGEVDYLKSCLYEFFLQLYNEQKLHSIFQPVSQLS
ncbi:MAG: YdcF family protein [Planctomycetes bacterium]|nr:YdcF family protein [Planctomycetota bacterium]